MSNNKLLNIEDRIEQLIFLAEMFNNQANILFKKYEEIKQCKDEGLIRLVVMQNVLYFHQVTLILGTIFEKSQKPDEQSLLMWQQILLQHSDSKWSKLDRVRNNYLDSHLPKFRNKLIAHKDYKRSGDSAISFLNPVRKEILEEAGKIIDDLKDYTQVEFKDPSIDSWFEDVYKPAFDKLNLFINQEKLYEIST